jgi:hypothetical protein
MIISNRKQQVIIYLLDTLATDKKHRIFKKEFWIHRPLIWGSLSDGINITKAECQLFNKLYSGSVIEKFFNFLDAHNATNAYVAHFNPLFETGGIGLTYDRLLVSSFHWEISKQGYSYWFDLNDKWERISGI